MKIRKFLDASPVFSLISTGQKISSDMDRFLATDEVNFLQALILVSIFFEPEKGVRPKELPATFQTTKGNISHCLSHLEGKRLIQRKKVLGDGRGYIMTLSSKGEKTCLRFIKYFDDLQREAESTLTEEKVRDFIANVETIRDLHQKYGAR